METDPTRMCELVVGLPDINVIGVGEWPLYLRIVIMIRHVRPVCGGCGGGQHSKSGSMVAASLKPRVILAMIGIP